MAKNSPPPPTLDLHGYPVDDVADAVDRFLLKAARDGKNRVRIMPGKGTGQVKNAVVDYLKKAGYPWQFEKTPGGQTNSGVLIVFMD